MNSDGMPMRIELLPLRTRDCGGGNPEDGIDAAPCRKPRSALLKIAQQHDPHQLLQRALERNCRGFDFNSNILKVIKDPLAPWWQRPSGGSRAHWVRV